MMIHEGVKVPADGVIIRCADLRVDESSLTGEAEGVWKVPRQDGSKYEGHWRRDVCYAGTLVMQGSAAVLVDKIASCFTIAQIQGIIEMLTSSQQKLIAGASIPLTLDSALAKLFYEPQRE